MTKTELKENITKIKKLLKKRDYGNIDTGIELARGLNEPAVFEKLLGGCGIDEEGKLVQEWRKVKVKDHAKQVLEAVRAMN